MKKSSIITMLAIVLGILLLGHFVVYEALLVAFSATNVHVIITLRIVFVLLAVSFVIASVLAQKYNNFLTRSLYRVSAVWLGCFNYFFLASVLYGLYMLVFPFSVVMSVIVYGITLLVCIYGIVHGNTIQTTRINVALPNLPQQWKGKRAIFISDLHLGQVRGKKFSEKIVRRIQEIAPDIVFIGGDVYDGVMVDAVDVVSPFAKLSVPWGIYFVMGNHEEFSSNELYRNALKNAGIRVLLDEKVIVEGMQIVGVDYKTTTKPEEFEKILHSLSIDSSQPSILLKHVPSYLHLEIAERAGISLQLSGHTHQAQVFPWMIFTHRMFKGFDYGLHKLKNMQVYTSSGVGTWGPPLRVGTRSEIVVIEFV